MNITDFRKITIGVLQGYFSNKSVLDKFGESNGSLVYDGQPIEAETIDAYTKTEANALLDAKANASTTYTKTEVDSALDLKADLADVIDNTVDNLTNYYKKTETYTKTEVNNLIAAIPEMTFEVVNSLPVSDIDSHTIYLVRNEKQSGTNLYDEYIRLSTNAWECLGQVSTDIDLSDLTDYVKKDDFLYATSTDISGIIGRHPIRNTGSGGSASIDVDSELSTTSENPVQNKVVKAALDLKADTTDLAGKVDTSSVGVANGVASLNASGKIPASQMPQIASETEEISKSAFDALSTAEKNDGTAYFIPDAIINDEDVITIDSALSSTSTNPVQNKVINTALSGKQNTLTAGTNVNISGNTISAPVSYSTSERVIGTWINGKPLYEKTIVETMPAANNQKYVDVGISLSYAFIVNCNAVASNGWSQPVPQLLDANASAMKNLRCAISLNTASSNANKLFLFNLGSTDFSNQTVYVTIRYTKTTD